MRPMARVEAGKAQVARREVKLLVVERIVGDVHLAIDAGEASRRRRGSRRCCDTGRRRGARRAKRRSPRRSSRGQLAQRLGGRAGDGLGQVEVVVIFFAAEVLRAEQLLQADDLRAALGGLADRRDGARRDFLSGRASSSSGSARLVNFSAMLRIVSSRRGWQKRFAGHLRKVPASEEAGYRWLPSARRMRRRTLANIAGVRRPVCVFCWLGW